MVKVEVKRAHLLTMMWAEALKMQLNPTKSVALGQIKLEIKGQKLKCEKIVKLLGGLVGIEKKSPRRKRKESKSVQDG
jgi:hypothetical protein